jgi:hypothetical protein
MYGAIHSLPQYVFMAWCLVKHRDNFTFTRATVPFAKLLRVAYHRMIYVMWALSKRARKIVQEIGRLCFEQYCSGHCMSSRIRILDPLARLIPRKLLNAELTPCRYYIPCRIKQFSAICNVFMSLYRWVSLHFHDIGFLCTRQFVTLCNMQPLL